MTHYIEVMRITGTGSDKVTEATGNGAGWDTVEETKTGFERCRRFSVPFEMAAYLLDLWIDGEMIDTIAIDETGYKALLG